MDVRGRARGATKTRRHEGSHEGEEVRAPEGRQNVASGVSPWVGKREAEKRKPRTGDRSSSRERRFCRPYGANCFLAQTNPRLTPWATFCRPSGALTHLLRGCLCAFASSWLPRLPP